MTRRILLCAGLCALLLGTATTSCKKERADHWGDIERSSELKAPTLKLPTDGGADEELLPTFTWTPARETNKGGLRYTIYISKSQTFTDSDIKARDLKQPSFTATEELETSTLYYWQVIAYDAENKKEERSAIGRFTTRAAAPSVKLLLGDAIDLGAERNIRFAWRGEHIPTEDVAGRPITPVYNLYFRYGNDHFNDAQPTRSRMQETEHTFVATRGNETLYWKVIMILGRDAYSSPVYSIKLGNTLPTPAVLQTPTVKLQSGNASASVTLRWTPSQDPDRVGTRAEKLTYDLYLGTSTNLGENDLRQPELEQTSYSATSLELGTTYYAKLITKDEHGAEIPSNVVSFVTPQAPQTSDELNLSRGSWTDSRDGKTYQTVTINGKTWLAENFAYLPYLEKDNNPQTRCSVYGMNKFAGALGSSTNTDHITVESSKAHPNYAKYGVMYSSDALADVVPSGWHIATDEEWQTLERLSGMTEADLIQNSSKTYRGASVAWFFAPNQGFTGEGLNKLQLNLMLGGYAKAFEERGMDSFVYYWAGGSPSVNYRAFNKTKTGILRAHFSPSLLNRMYLRLVKD